LNNIRFIDTLTGWAVGENGTLLKTINGGTIWQNESIEGLSSEENLLWIFFSDSINGWLGGSGIYHTSTGGVTPIHKTLVSNPSFTLYPNPAEEWVNLKTESPISSLKVTDALGREVFAQSEAFPENNRLDISAWKPGLYWLRIQTAEGTAVQKVVKK
ncbi:MAG TPA: T9SS type A sorting domain-containing protein, partial [Catalimonadaceae bacterium]|nr:T9SS type A sorting domain-containing protein [Catalimonadaceae bacterium]